MHVKEFLEANLASIQPGYVFAVFPESASNIYLYHVRRAAESLDLICDSVLDFAHPGDALADTLTNIQRAEVLIFDISGFSPNVMWEFGFALAIKDPERVIVICKKSDESSPFTVYNHRLAFQYDPNSKKSLSDLDETLRAAMRRITKAVTRMPRIASPDVNVLLNAALSAVEHKEWITAETLFQMVHAREPDNSFILNQWGIMHRSAGGLETANQKFEQALNLAQSDDEKAFTYTELAVLHQMNRKYSEAEHAFQKAQEADKTSVRLYTAWAEYYGELGDYFMAQAKIDNALAQVEDQVDNPTYRDLRLRHNYYGAKIQNRSKESFEQFKRTLERPSAQSPSRKVVSEGVTKGGGRLDGKSVTSETQKSKANRQRRSPRLEGPVELEERKRADLLDIKSVQEPQPVLLGASAPRAVRPGDTFAVRFVAYLKEVERSVKSKLKQLSPDSETYLAVREAYWRIGTKVKVQLYSPQLQISSPEEQFTWQGTKELIDFRVKAPSDCAVQKTILYFKISIGDISVADFVLDVNITCQPAVEEPLFISRKPASTGFASYSSKDRQRVLDRTSEICHSGLDLWMDCLDLRPGEKWKREIHTEIKQRDLFLLFWSINAKNSKWVSWELRTAKKEKGIYRIEPHPLDQTKPPRGLNGLHFGDPYMLIRQAYQPRD